MIFKISLLCSNETIMGWWGLIIKLILWNNFGRLLNSSNIIIFKRLLSRGFHVFRIMVFVEENILFVIEGIVFIPIVLVLVCSKDKI